MNIPVNVVNAVNLLIQQHGVNFEEMIAQYEGDKAIASQNDAWLTRKEAAEYARISIATIGRLIKSGKLKASKINAARCSRVLIAQKSLDAFLSSATVGTQK